MKALIGITGSIITCGGDDIFSAYERAYVNDDYISAVEKAGGIPIILPIVEEEENIKEMVSRVGRCSLSEGYDIDPSYWGEERRNKDKTVRFEKRSLQSLVTLGERNAKAVVLGICQRASK